MPFRTWRNTSTGPAAAELSEQFGLNIPLRWSIAHLYQAVLDEEPHVAADLVPHDARRVRALAAHRPQGDRRRRRLGDVPDRLRDERLRRRAARAVRRARRATARPACTSPPCCPRSLPAGERRRQADRRGRRACSTRSGALRPGVAALPARGRRRHRHGRDELGRAAHRQRQRRHEHLRDGRARAAPRARPPRARPGHHPGRRPRGDGALQQRRERARSVGRPVRRFAAAAGVPLDTDAAVRGAVPRGPRGRGRRRRAARLQPPRGRADRRARRRAAAVRPHARQPAHARQLHARAALRRPRDARPGMRVLSSGASSSTGCSRTAASSAPPASRSASWRAPSTPGRGRRDAVEGGAWGIAVLAAYLLVRRHDRFAPTSTTSLREGRVDTVDPAPTTSPASIPTSSATAPDWRSSPRRSRHSPERPGPGGRDRPRTRAVHRACFGGASVNKSAVVFDMDGVLVDSEPLWMRARKDLVQRGRRPLASRTPRPR